MDVEALINKVVKCAYTVHYSLSPGYLEKVYENALLVELQDNGIKAESQKGLEVRYRGHVVGEYVADIIVEDIIILEIKAVKNINVAHELQLVNYLSTTGMDHGLIINFGNESKIEIKRKYRTYNSKFSTKE